MSGLALTGVVTDDSGNSYDLKVTLARIAKDLQPKPDPKPEPAPQPQPPPEPSAEPNANTTGAKGALTNYTGPYTITRAGTVVDSKNITRQLLIRADNVTVKNCKITSSDYWGLDAEGSSGTKISHCTFVQPNGGNSCILTGDNSTIEYCDLSGPDNGIMISGVKATILSNYIHDLHPGAVGEAHVDGIQMGGGQNGVLIKGNSIRSWDTSCIFMKCDWDVNSPIRNVTIDGNWLRNETGKQTAATIYACSNKAFVSNIVVTNNNIEPGYTGSLATDTSAARAAVAWTNNTHIVTGASIPKP